MKSSWSFPSAIGSWQLANKIETTVYNQIRVPNFQDSGKINLDMFRRRFLSFPLVIGAVIIGVVSGKAIFGPPLDDYWKKKRREEEEASAAVTNNKPTESKAT
ncbi:hypothetical protein PIB30_087434 [Stylosanthes scabra]|uniref:Uncharacterized protein n=1 Tax=Stylosanthes scabra TaxID=79078 RepID=A0ABU6SUQ7_9FABA|nr:hypothetical protein [Stylosanthes scabra]